MNCLLIDGWPAGEVCAGHSVCLCVELAVDSREQIAVRIVVRQHSINMPRRFGLKPLRVTYFEAKMEAALGEERRVVQDAW